MNYDQAKAIADEAEKRLGSESRFVQELKRRVEKMKEIVFTEPDQKSAEILASEEESPQIEVDDLILDIDLDTGLLS